MNTIDARAAEYERVRHWLDAQVAAFYDHHGYEFVAGLCGPFDELRVLADEVFLKAFDDYDPGVGTRFSSYVGFKVWKEMSSAVRTAMRGRRGRLPAERLESVPSAPAGAFSLGEFIASLGDDARQVVEIALGDTPRGVARALAELDPLAHWRPPTPTTLRRAVKQYLCAAGWSAARVAEAFKEVKEALA